ncbi:MAG: AraC family transcriptional regulator [Actinobacteria bacterium]|nr:AraC family transcriptional regulator [Actinomycetota bacterium]
MSSGCLIAGIDDWATAHRAVAQAYFPHELKPLDDRDKVALRLRTVELGGVTLGQIAWGASVSIACDYPGAYEVNVPLSGRLHSREGGADIVSPVGRARVFHADRPSLITNWPSDCYLLGVKFDAECLEREADRLRIDTVRRRLALPFEIDVASGSGAEWFRLVRALAEQLREPAALLTEPPVARQLAGALTTALLLAAAPADAGSVAPLRPRIVKRVLDALNDDPARPWALSDMAVIAQTSPRRLQEAFAEFVGTTPTGALLDIRLDRARCDLDAGDVTVSEVAARWGFSSGSRFASAYRRRYGVSPSHTLRH